MPYKYPDGFHPTLIRYQPNGGCIRRYGLSIEMPTPGTRRVVTILQNPSSTTEKCLDTTNYRVMMYVYRKACQRAWGFMNVHAVDIVNLFSVYATDPKALAAMLNDDTYDFVAGNEPQKDRTNDRVLEDMVRSASLVIAAWGNWPAGAKDYYVRRIREISRLVDVNSLYMVRDKTQDGNPYHGLRWRYDDPVKRYMIPALRE